MSGTAPQPRQALWTVWVAQIVGTIVVALIVAAFVRAQGAPFAGAGGHGFDRYALTAILGAAVPALWFLRRYKARLEADAAALRAPGGTPDPSRRRELLRGLSIGGALCELPMAVGALNLFCGGDSRWFVGATFITLAIRLSYRPFVRQVS